MRTKEQAADYRFISDPDLPIIKIESQRVKKIQSQLPETPKEKLTKLIRKLIREKENDTNVFKIFEKIMHEEPKHKKCF